MPATTKVLVGHSSPLLRAGLRSTLAYEHDFILVGEAYTIEYLLRLCQRLHPDIMLLEPEWLESDIIRTYLEHYLPHLRMLLFGDGNATSFAQYVSSEYIVGHVPIEVEPNTLVQALRTIAHGSTWFTEDTIAQLMDVATEESPGTILSKREHEVLQLLVGCHNNQEIAAILSISDKTVAKYLRSLYTKLGVDSRLAAAMYAVQHGLVELPASSTDSNTMPLKRRKTSQ